MPRARFSLSTLMGIVAVLAAGLAGITSPSTFWTTAAATVTLALLLSAILASWLLRLPDRAFWFGFALFGWTYLLLVNWDWIGGQMGHDLSAPIGAAAEWLIPDLPPPVAPPPYAIPAPAGPFPPPSLSSAGAPAPVPARAFSSGRVTQIAPGGGAPAGAQPAPAPRPTPVFPTGSDYFALVKEREMKIGNFVQISRMALSLLFALLGGLIGRVLAEQRERQTGAGAAVPPG